MKFPKSSATVVFSATALAANPDWKGTVDELWLETSQLMHARVAIDWMKFTE